MKLAIFDFDGTLFQKETLPYILNYWAQNKYAKLPLIKTYYRIILLFIKYKLKLDKSLDKEKFRSTAAMDFIKLFEGMSRYELIHFFETCSHAMKFHFNKTIVSKVNEAKENGFHTVICSGNYILSLKEVSKYVPFDTVIGTELFFDNKEFIDYTRKIKVITGKNKLEELLKTFENVDIDWLNSYSYGDSYYDQDILSITGNPVAVTPDDRLREIAISKGWTIL